MQVHPAIGNYLEHQDNKCSFVNPQDRPGRYVFAGDEVCYGQPTDENVEILMLGTVVNIFGTSVVINPHEVFRKMGAKWITMPNRQTIRMPVSGTFLHALLKEYFGNLNRAIVIHSPPLHLHGERVFLT